MRCLTLHATFLTFGCFALALDALAQEALSTFKDCDVCPELVVIPGGSFMMGSRSREESLIEVDRHPVMGLFFFDNEGPQHRVTIRHPFAVGKYEVTFREWDACVADGGCNGYRPDDEGWGRGNRPVINVSWDDAQAYPRWLSKKSGAEYRLLTEAEWEYAARGDTTAARYWGNGPAAACGFANVYDRTSKSVNELGWTYHECTDGYAMTAPVGSFRANSLGLYDVLGNVWEWVEDCYNDSYTGAPGDGRVWTLGDCRIRVSRGGAWGNPPAWVRSAQRHWGKTYQRENFFGFRVARTLP